MGSSYELNAELYVFVVNINVSTDLHYLRVPSHSSLFFVTSDNKKRWVSGPLCPLPPQVIVVRPERRGEERVMGELMTSS